VASECDVAEFCTGSAAACPVDGFRTAGAVCRVSTDVCDPAEQCSGSVATCPADEILDDGSECDDEDECTSDDICTEGVCAGEPIEDCLAADAGAEAPDGGGITVDGGDDDAGINPGDGAGGCGCRTAGSSGGATTGLLILLAAALIGRRRSCR
jgi:MYXO-CTERM domain-containing protein